MSELLSGMIFKVVELDKTFERARRCSCRRDLRAIRKMNEDQNTRTPRRPPLASAIASMSGLGDIICRLFSH